MKQARTISITGESKLDVRTDSVQFLFTVTGVAWTNEDALVNLVNEIIRIKDAAAKNGFKKEDVKTSSFVIEPRSKYDDHKKIRLFDGYEAEEHLTLTIENDSTRINKLLKSLACDTAQDTCRSAEKGWKDTDFRLSFICSNPESYESALIESAVKNAKEKAALIARSSGVTLKKIINIDYSYGMITVEPEMEMDKGMFFGSAKNAENMCEMPDMEVQDTPLSKRITMTWEIGG